MFTIEIHFYTNRDDIVEIFSLCNKTQTIFNFNYEEEEDDEEATVEETLNMT